MTHVGQAACRSRSSSRSQRSECIAPTFDPLEIELAGAILPANVSSNADAIRGDPSLGVNGKHLGSQRSGQGPPERPDTSELGKLPKPAPAEVIECRAAVLGEGVDKRVMEPEIERGLKDRLRRQAVGLAVIRVSDRHQFNPLGQPLPELLPERAELFDGATPARSNFGEGKPAGHRGSDREGIVGLSEGCREMNVPIGPTPAGKPAAEIHAPVGWRKVHDRARRRGRRKLRARRARRAGEPFAEIDDVLPQLRLDRCQRTMGRFFQIDDVDPAFDGRFGFGSVADADQ